MSSQRSVRPLSRASQQIWLFSLGGTLYNLCELFWSGSTHGSMFFVGGLCFQIIGWIHATFYKLSLFRRCVLCSGAVTAVEFVSGLLINRVWRWQVWDYSERFLNVAGQICLLYTVIWGILGAAACPVFRYIYPRFTGRAFPLHPRAVPQKRTAPAEDTSRI